MRNKSGSDAILLRKFMLRPTLEQQKREKMLDTDPLSVMKHELFCSLHFDKWTSEWHPWNLCIFSFTRRQKEHRILKWQAIDAIIHMVQKKNYKKNNDKVYANDDKFQNFFLIHLHIFSQTIQSTNQNVNYCRFVLWKI